MSLSSEEPRPRIRRSPKPSLSPLYVSQISVEGLFGRLSYPSLNLRQEDDARRISVIYGDNGTGKTTILRLLYACLSPSRKAGLRTLVAKTPFLRFSVSLSDGSSITYLKTQPIGEYAFHADIGGKKTVLKIEVRDDGTVGSQESIVLLENILTSLGFDILFVDHNRVVQSTYAFLSDLPKPQQDVSSLWSTERSLGLTFSEARILSSSLKETDLQFPLPQIVAAVERWFRTEAFRQGTTGEQNAAAVYLDIARALGKKRGNTPAAEEIDLVSALDSLAKQTHSYIEHGLLSAYPFSDLIEVYRNTQKPKRRQIEIALNPFVDTVRRRIAALLDVHKVMTTFENELNKYFMTKRVDVHVLNGLSISDADSKIDLNFLSSGEKQLVFLLSSAVVARSSRSLILVDEPELSLNYKWQRLIAASLASISAPSNTQFILASHSIEIITQFVNSSVELSNP